MNGIFFALTNVFVLKKIIDLSIVKSTHYNSHKRYACYFNIALLLVLLNWKHGNVPLISMSLLWKYIWWGFICIYTVDNKSFTLRFKLFSFVYFFCSLMICFFSYDFCGVKKMINNVYSFCSFCNSLTI